MPFSNLISDTLDCQLVTFCKFNITLFDECLAGVPAYSNCLIMASERGSSTTEAAYFIPQGVNFDKSKLKDLFSKKYVYDCLFFNAYIEGIPFFAIPGLDIVKINSIDQLSHFNSLLNFENTHAYPFRDYILSGTIAKLCIYVLRSIKDSYDAFYDTLNQHFENARLIKILTYIHQHMQEDITLDKLGELVDLSPDYISQFFKRCLGMSIQSYLIDQRVKLGLYYLVSSSEQISQISTDTGFVDQAYFNRRFKLFFGINPLKLRKKYQLLFVSQAGVQLSA